MSGPMRSVEVRRVMLADFAWLVAAGVGAGCAASLALVIGGLGLTLLP
jgi:hypothetical protein